MPEETLLVELADRFAFALYRVLEQRGFSRREIALIEASDTPVDGFAMKFAKCLMADRCLEVLLEDVRHWIQIECIDG